MWQDLGVGIVPGVSGRTDQGGVRIDDTLPLSSGGDDGLGITGCLMGKNLYTFSSGWSMIINRATVARYSNDQPRECLNPVRDQGTA